jgi:hypothetical protein
MTYAKERKIKSILSSKCQAPMVPRIIPKSKNSIKVYGRHGSGKYHPKNKIARKQSFTFPFSKTKENNKKNEMKR